MDNSGKDLLAKMYGDDIHVTKEAKILMRAPPHPYVISPVALLVDEADPDYIGLAYDK